MINKIRNKTIITIVLSIALATQTFGGTKEWVGGDNNDSYWSSNSNWAGIGDAGRNDDLVFLDRVPRFGTDESACPTWCTFVNRKTNYNDIPINTSFDSLSFRGSNYVISGNQIFLGRQSGAQTINVSTGAFLGADPIFNPNIILGVSQRWNCSSALTLNGIVNLNDRVLTINGIGDIVMNGTVTNGRIDKTNSGDLILNGTVSNADLSNRGAGIVFIGGNASAINPNLDAGDTRVAGTLGRVNLEGGTISGSGTVSQIADFDGPGGVISPGNGGNTSGRLRIAGGPADFSHLSPNVKFAIDLNGTFPASRYDQLSVTNTTLALSGAEIDLSLGFTPTTGQQFTIIQGNSSTTILGQFDQGISMVEDNQLFSITYNTTSVVLTALGPAVP